MPIRRRFTSRRNRRSTFRKRSWKKFTRRYKKTRGPRVHSFKRTYAVGGITMSAANYAEGYTFKLSDLPNSSEFTALFDQYKINAVKFVISPTSTGNDLQAQSSLLSIHSAIDHNDNTNPANISELMQYDTYKRTRMMRGHSRYFKVNLLTPISTAAGVSTTWNRWINTSCPDAEYFGLKVFIDRPWFTGDDGLSFEVYATYYFQCKSVI